MYICGKNQEQTEAQSLFKWLYLRKHFSGICSQVWIPGKSSPAGQGLPPSQNLGRLQRRFTSQRDVPEPWPYGSFCWEETHSGDMAADRLS